MGKEKARGTDRAKGKDRGSTGVAEVESDAEGSNVSKSNDGGFDANVEIKTKR